MLEGLEASVLNLSEIPIDNIDFRIDSEYFSKRYLKFDLFLKSKKSDIISKYAKVSDGDHSKFPDNQKKDVRYLQAKDIKNHFIENSNPVYISRGYFEKNKRSHVKEENVILSIMGSVGDIAITPKGFVPTLANRAVAIIKDIREINPYYLFTYLSTKYGQLQIDRQKNGGVQERINLDVLSKVKIPIVKVEFQLEIENLVRSGHKIRKKSRELYQQAEDTLMFEVGLNTLSSDFLRKIELQLKPNKTPEETIEYLEKYTVSERNTFEAAHDMFMEMLDANPNLIDDLMERGEVELAKRLLKGMETKMKLHEYDLEQAQKNRDLLIKGYEAQKNLIALSEAKLKNYNIKKLSDSFIKTGRLDAEYYQKKYDELELIIISQKHRRIKDIRLDNFRGLQPIYFENGDLDVINSKHILNNTLDYDKFEKTSLEYWNKQEKARVYKGDILTYTTGANIGRTQVYLKDSKALASNHVNIIRLKEENPYYIGFVLNSLIGRLQTEKRSAGSAQAELYPKDLDEFLIPIIDLEKQEQIVELVEQSFKLKAESERLLEVVKKAVEMAIEEGEDKAMKYVKESAK